MLIIFILREHRGERVRFLGFRNRCTSVNCTRWSTWSIFKISVENVLLVFYQRFVRTSMKFIVTYVFQPLALLLFDRLRSTFRRNWSNRSAFDIVQKHLWSILISIYLSFKFLFVSSLKMFDNYWLNTMVRCPWPGENCSSSRSVDTIESQSL